MFPGLGLVFVTHDQNGKLRRLPNLLVELPFDGLLVCYQRDLPALGGHRLYQEIAFSINRAESAMLDFQQLVGHASCFTAIAKIGGQDAQLLPLSDRWVLPEQGFDLCPGEEIGVHNLV